MSVIEDLVRQGLIRYFAVSNFTVDQLRLYQAAEQNFSIRSRIIAVQNQYDILNFELNQPGVLSYCQKNGISFVPFSPLARGLLTSRYLNKTKVGPGDRLFDEGTFEKDMTTENFNKLTQLADIAMEMGIELNQLSLAYMLTLPGMGPQIPASSTVDQLESNALAGKIIIPSDQISRIDNIIFTAKKP